MTTTPAPPTFIQTPVGLACPAPGCNRTYIYKGAAEKHWQANHQPSTNGHQGEPDPFDLDRLAALMDEVEQEKNAEQDDGDQPQYEEDEPEAARGWDAPLTLLTPHEVLERTCHADVDRVLATADAVVGLTDALIRLVHAGYDRADALQIVLDLIDKLDGAPA
ncbi:hypothetical protein [Ornithinimicrobium cerasi]|uniref:hypothetical protein n=1 Tax=Ornithinimicrobium cerasi TaxID=2248773 RepID=UPI000F001BDD|nr:hypothetical protein [Ornithinimicrobium cerasi]